MMSVGDTISIEAQIAQTAALLRHRLGTGGADLSRTLAKAKHRLPRRIYRQGQRLARAEAMSHHPKLRLTLDQTGLGQAAQEVQAHLTSIDLADRRKGWMLGVLGALSFNLILAFALLIAFLVWQGFL